MMGKRPVRTFELEVALLEGRALMGGTGTFDLGALVSKAMPRLVLPSGVRYDPEGAAAVINALNGGAGNEFVTLVKRQVPNYRSIINQFILGQRTSFNTPGGAAKISNWQPLYTGQRFDHLTATLAGAIVLPNKKLELAGVMRGKFDEAVPSQVVFGINRGAGAAHGPIFGSQPSLTPDALVTVNVGPFGKNNSATVTDLRTGAVKSVSAKDLMVKGSVVRVYVDLKALPSTGASLSDYTFAMWTKGAFGGGIENVGSFVPDGTMIPIGFLNPVRTAGR